ncbi:MAG: carotenoid oxygenase family protein [Pseudomonadales bacterium]|nr:carotenoid oxygenase family protein [Pseudomonadales bacterium]
MSARPEDYTSRYLSGNYEPVFEEVEAVDLEVIGEIPKDLSGHFLRIGPNPYFVPDMDRYHIFDGDGMIHSVAFSGGQATYRNKFIDSKGLQEEREKGEWIYPGLNLFGDVIARGEMPKSKNTGNTAMVFHQGKLFGLMEGGTPYEVSLPNLTTVGEHDFDGTLNHNFTAHPKVDAKTGEMMTFGYSPFPPYLTYSVVSAEGRAVHTQEITIPKGIMMHDCAITAHYPIFPDLPLVFDFDKLLKGESMIGWEPENGCRIGVVPRFGSDDSIRWFEIEESFLFHVANAWEDGDEIVLQACRSDRGAIETSADQDVREQLGRLHEWRLNLTTGAVSSKLLLANDYCDFPRIQDDLVGYQNRFIYAARFRVDERATFDAELKYDNQTGAVQVHEFGPDKESGEAVFAPKRNAQSEDDGYVICFVNDSHDRSCECHIIDAQNFEGPAVARIKIPSRVPHGFHASWVPVEPG